MQYLHFVSYFFGGAFLANAVPHFVSGALGRHFKVRSRRRPDKGRPHRP